MSSFSKITVGCCDGCVAPCPDACVQAFLDAGFTADSRVQWTDAGGTGMDAFQPGGIGLPGHYGVNPAGCGVGFLWKQTETTAGANRCLTIPPTLEDVEVDALFRLFCLDGNLWFTAFLPTDVGHYDAFGVWQSQAYGGTGEHYTPLKCPPAPAVGNTTIGLGVSTNLGPPSFPLNLVGLATGLPAEWGSTIDISGPF